MDKIYYGYYHSPIGVLEVITNNEMILSISFVEVNNSSKEQPEILRMTIKQLDEYFNGLRKEFNLRYCLAGTEFQKSAWDALTKIPYGETWSYKKQAQYIGNERAVRAVGNANNKNAISIIIPCHRVIGIDNKLVGYASGIKKKQWLLEHERKYLNQK